MKFDERGRELPDATPIEIPVGMRKPESMAEMIARFVRSDQLAREMHARGHETFEEANDFEIEGEDAELHATQYESMVDEAPRGIYADKDGRTQDARGDSSPTL